jgi:hypothetical protein
MKGPLLNNELHRMQKEVAVAGRTGTAPKKIMIAGLQAEI